MKVIALRKSLSEAISLAHGATAARTPMVALTCIQLEANDHGLEIRATDNVRSVRVNMNAVQVVSPGKAMVDAEKLDKIFREADDETATISLEGDRLVVAMGEDGDGATYDLYTRPDPMPLEPYMESPVKVIVPAKSLAELFKKTSFAAGLISLAQYTTDGVLIEAEGKKMTCVGTNGNRVAIAECDLNIESPKLSVQIPKAVVELFGIISETDADAAIATDGNRVTISVDDAVIGSPLVVGNFVPYRSVIPVNKTHKATVSTAALLQKVRQAGLMTSVESCQVLLSFKDNRLTMTSRSPIAGAANVSLPCKYEGAPTSVGMQQSYLLSHLSRIEDEDITIETDDSNKAILFNGGRKNYFVISAMTAVAA